MATLRDLVLALQRRDGVEAVLVLGRDGLLVDVAGLEHGVAEQLAALTPSLVNAAELLGDAMGRGALHTAVVEYAGGLAVATTLSRDVALLAVLAADADPGPVVYELRRSRGALAALV